MHIARLVAPAPAVVKPLWQFEQETRVAVVLEPPSEEVPMGQMVQPELLPVIP